MWQSWPCVNGLMTQTPPQLTAELATVRPSGSHPKGSSTHHPIHHERDQLRTSWFSADHSFGRRDRAMVQYTDPIIVSTMRVVNLIPADSQLIMHVIIGCWVT